MGALTYFMCAATSFLCAWQLFRGYRRSRVRMLFWSAGCFATLTVSNLILVADRIFLPNVDLSTPRLVSAFVGIALLVFGLIWETD